MHGSRASRQYCQLLRDLAFRLVGWVFDLRLKAFKHARQEGGRVSRLFSGLELVRERNVTGQIREHDAPSKGVVPGAGSEADVLTLFSHPYPEDLKGGFVASGGRWNFEVLGGWHGCKTPDLLILWNVSKA